MSKWIERPLVEVADYNVGKTPSRANASYWTPENSSQPWVTISDMPPFGRITSTKEQVSEQAMTKVFGGRLVPAGTLLMSFKLTIGRVATLAIPAVHNEAIISIRPKAGMDQGYLAYYLSQVDYTQSQDRQIKGNTLNKSKIDRIPISAPGEPEQRQIAAVLGLVRDAADGQATALDATEVLKSAVMQELFTRGLHSGEPQDSEIGPIPTGWDPRAISDLCDIWSGGTPKKGVEAFWEGDIPWVSGKDIKRPAISDAIDHVSEAGAAAGSRIAPSDAVLVLVRGMGLAKDLPVATISQPMAFNQDVKALTLKSRYADHPGRFLRSAIYAGKERLLNQIVPSAHGTMTLNLNDVESMVLPWPSDANESHAVVEVLDALDAKIDLHRQKRALYEELFQALLHGLMTQEISIDDLDLTVLLERQAVPV